MWLWEGGRVFKCVHTFSLFVYFLLPRLISDGIAPVSLPLCSQYLCVNKEAAMWHVLRVCFHLRPRPTPTHSVSTWISNVSRVLCVFSTCHTLISQLWSCLSRMCMTSFLLPVIDVSAALHTQSGIHKKCMAWLPIGTAYSHCIRGS